MCNMEFKILYLYPDILDLYGDIGNIKVLKYRLEQRGIKCIIDRYSIGNEKPEFSDYDFVFLGGGADNEQQAIMSDLMENKNSIKKAVDEGVFFLLICGGYQLFGKYYKDANGEIIPGLEIFDYYTEASQDKTKRCIGNIIIEANIENEPYKVIGFENHGGQTSNVSSTFGKVELGNGNKFGSSEEGFMLPNVICTYLHGPLLSKNPKIADYIIKHAWERKYNKNIELEKLNDSLEEKCREYLFSRFNNN